jgi:hypothetical protein
LIRLGQTNKTHAERDGTKRPKINENGRETRRAGKMQREKEQTNKKSLTELILFPLRFFFSKSTTENTNIFQMMRWGKTKSDCVFPPL